MRVIELLVTLPNPYPGTLTCPSTPKVLQARERGPTPSPSNVFTFGLTIESIKEFGGASKIMASRRSSSSFLFCFYVPKEDDDKPTLIVVFFVLFLCT
jgi:hypothetical protein